MKKLGFALGAGGSRGVAHIGFLEAKEEAGIKPDYITGCSMGAIVGGAYAAGVSIEQIKNVVLKLRLLDFISPTSKKGGFFGSKKIWKLLERFMKDITFDELEIPFRCIAVDMFQQEVVEMSEGSVLDAMVASATIPAVFHPIEKEGRRLVDGGILERVPAMRVKEMGAEIVVAVDVLGWRECDEECPGAIGMLLDMIDLMDNHRTRLYHEKHKDQIDFWLEPELGNMDQFSLKRIDMAYRKGYELGKANAAAIKEALKG